MSHFGCLAPEGEEVRVIPDHFPILCASHSSTWSCWGRKTSGKRGRDRREVVAKGGEGGKARLEFLGSFWHLSAEHKSTRSISVLTGHFLD